MILDGEPATMAENTTAIYFAEHEAGFLAGVAAALQSQTGKVGFIGGIDNKSLVVLDEDGVKVEPKKEEKEEVVEEVAEVEEETPVEEIEKKVSKKSTKKD